MAGRGSWHRSVPQPADGVRLLVASGRRGVERVLRDHISDPAASCLWRVILSAAWEDSWRNIPSYKLALACLKEADAEAPGSRSFPWTSLPATCGWLRELRGAAKRRELLAAAFADAGTFGDASRQHRLLSAYSHLRSIARRRLLSSWDPACTVPGLGNPAPLLQLYLPVPVAREVDPNYRCRTPTENKRSADASQAREALRAAERTVTPLKPTVLIVGPENWPEQDRRVFVDSLLGNDRTAYRRIWRNSLRQSGHLLRCSYGAFLYRDLHQLLTCPPNRDYRGSPRHRVSESYERLVGSLSRFCAPKEPTAVEALARQSEVSGRSWQELQQEHIRQALPEAAHRLHQTQRSKIGSHDWVRDPSGRPWEDRPTLLTTAPSSSTLRYLGRQLISKTRAAVEARLRDTLGYSVDEGSDALEGAKRINPLDEHTPLNGSEATPGGLSPSRLSGTTAAFEARDLIQTLISRADLNVKEKTVVNLEVRDLTNEAIANEMGISKGYVSTLKSNAHRKLREARDEMGRDLPSAG